MRNTKKILGFDVDLTTFEGGIERVVELSKKQNVQIVTINPEMIAAGEKDAEFGQILRTADVVVPDGFGIVLALAINGIKQKRIPGIEFSFRLLEYCAENGIKTAFIGAEEEVLQKACANLKSKIPNLEIAYMHNGFFGADEEPKIAEDAANSGAKLVLVATGVPKQEKFITKHKEMFKNTVFAGVGGSFDVWSGKVRRAPAIFAKTGFEWLWRLLCAPSRFKRIFPTLPIFLIRVIMEKFDV